MSLEALASEVIHLYLEFWRRHHGLIASFRLEERTDEVLHRRRAAVERASLDVLSKVVERHLGRGLEPRERADLGAVQWSVIKLIQETFPAPRVLPVQDEAAQMEALTRRALAWFEPRRGE